MNIIIKSKPYIVSFFAAYGFTKLYLAYQAQEDIHYKIQQNAQRAIEANNRFIEELNNHSMGPTTESLKKPLKTTKTFEKELK
jgi:hypothetical protein